MHELRIFLGIIIYMGVFGKTSLDDYWSTSGKYPQHSINKYMSLYRFQQIKRYLHVSPLNDAHVDWHTKLRPLSSKLQQDFTRLFLPSTDVSVDEMIVRFSGRSKHTVKMKCKPTPEGYKIFALCQAGYTYSFLFYSPFDSIIAVTKLPNISITSSAVAHLAKLFPIPNTDSTYTWITISPMSVSSSIFAPSRLALVVPPVSVQKTFPRP